MKFAIAAGHKETAKAAQEILKEGGNAVDAGIAAFAASWVAEPCMSSPGGGGFANIFIPGKGCQMFDFFCQTPKIKRPVNEVDFFPIEVNFGDTTEIFHVGNGSIGTPGAIAGVFELHKRFGSIPIEELFQPAIHIAKNGVLVSDFQFLDFKLLESILRLNPQAEPIFFKNGEIVKVGATKYMVQLADFLEILAKEGADLFYKGEIAQRIIQDCADKGGYLVKEDFNNYEVFTRNPLKFRFQNKSIYTNDYPGIGGDIIQFLLSQKGISGSEYPKKEGDFISDWYHRLKLLQDRPNDLRKENLKRGSTTHFNIVDKDGKAVSLTVSNGEGSGYFIEGTDIQLNNMLGEAALLPDGFHSWTPNTRLSSMMSPTIVLDENSDLELVLGSGGAGRIPAVIAQVIQLVLEKNHKLNVAVQAPRVFLDEHHFHIEPGFETLPNIVQLKEWEEQSLFFGGVHTIHLTNGSIKAVGDDRRDGVGIVE